VYAGLGRQVVLALVSLHLPTKPWLSAQWMGLPAPNPAARIFARTMLWAFIRFAWLNLSHNVLAFALNLPRPTFTASLPLS
jgi:hypothetical protein